MIELAYDWIGPEGPWPNGQNLDLLASPNNYKHAQYAINNNIYNLESRRHPFTYSKIQSILGNRNTIQKHILQCKGKFVYELTPLLKPYQWTDTTFDNVSSVAIQAQQTGKCLFVINDMNEGYSNKEYNFFENIHLQIEKYLLNPINVMYITMNSVAKTEYAKWAARNNIYKQINIQEVYLYEYADNKNLDIANPSTHFICLNRQPNPLRQCLIYELWRRDLLKYGHVSMPSPSDKLDFNFDKDNLKLFDIDDSQWDEFLNTLPYIADGRSFLDQTCNTNSITDFYFDSVYSVITENTLGDIDCVKLSEKTFRSLGNYCLPLYMYSPGIGQSLTKLGYEVDADIIINDAKRFWALINKLEHICQINIKQLHKKTKKIRIKNNKNLLAREKSTILQTRRDIQTWLDT